MNVGNPPHEKNHVHMLMQTEHKPIGLANMQYKRTEH